MSDPRAKEIIDDIIKREGGFVNDKVDRGLRTDKGISERAHPSAWRDGKITYEEARSIYERLYFIGPGFDKIPASHHKTQEFLVDFAVNSGPMIAIKKLQEIVGETMDGIMGSKTIAALLGIDDRSLTNLLVAARLRMVGRLVQRNPSDLKFLSGWINRCLEFLK